ncbi:CCAAT-binding factor, subunit C (HAP5) [Handroanthus impetiginosus]|uniref:CCAAT-binding factor, subunit C (HAP5) n=1 Tax=Handroanthus impetiginosus TaxID=429701 RepID=A0A2G9GG33_9LAMI|nr:CCAAT-binding factor, subunit C (HAP5) [Handroanthus impetiginosus]
MGTNQPIQFSSTSRPPLHMHDFMPIPSATITLHDNHEREDIRNSQFTNQMRQNMQSFWKERLTEICEASSDVHGQHVLPLARIKKVIKSNEQVKMVSADTSVLFAKACEIFVMELTLRAWMRTQESNRRTLQRDDVASAIRDDDLLVFLKDIIPMKIHQEAPLSLANHLGGYVPFTEPNISSYSTYAMNMQNTNKGEVASNDHSMVVDHRSTFPVNLHYNITHTYSQINQEMQHVSVFSPPPPPLAAAAESELWSPPLPPAPTNADNPYFNFKVW